MIVTTANEFTGYLNAFRDVYTELGLKYRNWLQQGIKADEMLNDLFVYDVALDMIENYDSGDLAAWEESLNYYSPEEMRTIFEVLNCIRVKYNININFAPYLIAAESGGAPINALQDESGNYILTEDGLYILVE